MHSEKPSVIAVLILCLARVAVAGPLEDVDAAIKKRDYATAVRIARS
jgi:hypothetical protein